MKKLLYLVVASFMLQPFAIHGQGLLKKFSKKAEQMISEKLDKKTTTTLDSTTDRGLRKTYDKGVDQPLNRAFDENEEKKRKKNANQIKTDSTSQASTSATSPITSRTRANNSKGAGLKPEEAPDIDQQLSLADTAYKSGELKDARRALKRGIQALELKIGKNILQSFPEKIGELERIRDEDQVQSSDIGWNSMFISRTYVKDDQEFTISVSNGGANGENLASLVYDYKKLSQTIHTDASVKEIKIRNHKGHISFNESKGYEIVIPLSRDNAVTCGGVNFSDEDSFVAAVNQVNIDVIKKSMNLN